MHCIRDYLHVKMRRENLTQKDVAQRMGVSPTSLSLRATGKRKITTEYAQKIAQALDMTLWDFMLEAERYNTKAGRVKQ